MEKVEYINRVVSRLMDDGVSANSIYFSLYGDYFNMNEIKVVEQDYNLNLSVRIRLANKLKGDNNE